MTDAADHGRLLVVGLSPVVDQGVVDLLHDEAIDAQGETDPDTAADRIEARGLGLVAFGRGALGPRADRLKAAFAATSPDLRIVDAIGPLAARQIVAALRHDPRGPRFVRGLELRAGPCGHRLVAEVPRGMPIRLAVFELGPGPSLREERLVDAVAPVGPWRCVLDDDQVRRSYSLVLTANSEEHRHLHMLDQG